jgi:gliding motility-associated-like protein
MLTNKRVLLLSVFAIFFTLRLYAQNSLGDPVFNEDFGRGTNLTPVGPPMDFRRTKLDYTRNKCPNVDAFGRGQYCIAFTTSNCFDGTWRTIYDNHTPNDPYGYMMIINASEAPDVIYTNDIPGEKFCAGAKYQLQVYVYNILNELPGNVYQQPDIEFTVAKTNGVLLQAAISTGKIPAVGSWVPYSIDFIAPMDGSDVTITLKNKTTGTDNGNDFVLDDITVKAYGPVIDIGLGAATSPDAITQNQCLGDGEAKYYLKAFVHNYASPVYQWQSNINNGGWKNITGKTQDHLDLETEFSNPQPGKYQYRLGALSGPGVSLNCQTFSEAITINVFKNPVYSLPPVTPFCKGEILTLTADKGSDYLWTLPDGTTSTDHYLTVTTSADKSYEGEYKVKITENGCSTTTKTQVIVGEPLVATVDNANPIVCEGDAVQIGANGGTTYKWTPALGLDHDDIAKPMANPSVTTEYQVLVSNGFCERKQTVTVTVIKKPHADAGPDRVMMEGEPITLQGTVTGDNVNHYWTSDGPIDDVTSLTPKVSPTESTTYILHAESTNDCGTVSDEVFVRVFKKLTIPTTFTPNNDGVNDTWKIDKLVTYPESVLTIYTRAGSEVFRTVGDARQWNGNYGGKFLPAGVYYYVIDLKNNLPKKAGWVMLIR